MSRAPLTDAQAYDVGGAFHKDGAVVAAGFARHLEETREDARIELGIAQSRLASIFLSGALDDKLCGDIQKWAKDYTAEIARLRAELAASHAELAQRRQAMADIVRELGEGCCGLFHEEIAPKVKEMRTELAAERAECLEQARLNGMGSEREATLLGKIEVMRRALEEIASYDKDSKHGEGICPYGCDTPWIARTALSKAGRIA